MTEKPCGTTVPVLAPFVRGRLVIAAPSEPGLLVQLEFILCDPQADDSPSWDDLPESREAGWSVASFGPLQLAMRAFW